MTNKDLMVGDLLWNANGVVEVDQILGDTIITTDGDEVEISELEPIKVTGELLEKNGFSFHEEMGFMDHYMSEDARLVLYYDETFINSDNAWYIHIDNDHMETIASCDFTYLHELQHMLKLCKYKLNWKV